MSTTNTLALEPPEAYWYWLVSASLLSILCKPQLGAATLTSSVLSMFCNMGQGGRGAFGGGAGVGAGEGSGSCFSGSFVSGGGTSGVGVVWPGALTVCLGLRDLVTIWLASPTLTLGIRRRLSSRRAVSSGAWWLT